MGATELELTLAPYEVAHDTTIVPQLVEAPPVGYVTMNSMVIAGQEPVIVDTGAPSFRDRWLRLVSDIVDPDDVTWIFLTHDDRDHAGNLMQAMEMFPNATLLTTWFAVGRMEEEFVLPKDRIRFLNDGEHINLADRTLLAVRPPLFDNPTTRGVFDSATGVYHAVDSFLAMTPFPMENADQWDETSWEEALDFGNRLLSPWHQWLDAGRWNQHVDRSASLPIKALVTGHSPVVTGARIAKAFEAMRALPRLAPWPEPTRQEFALWMDQAHERVGAGERSASDPRLAYANAADLV